MEEQNIRMAIDPHWAASAAGDQVAEHQIYHDTKMASFRAIEQGFNLVRHTSQGLSAAFDYQGRQLASMDHYLTTDRVLVAQVPTRGTRTVYAFLGDWFAWACLAGLAGVVTLGIKSRR
jgi:apolipoprotein N-acyltransferase